jgi:RNA polymerase sigma-70 factor (ECF subfamily)
MTTDPDQLAADFTRARPRLVRVAYAILGTRAEAEDVVADCWFRLVCADRQEPVRDVEGWSVVAVSRMALDVLRSARVRRERYVGPWLPEPVVASSDAAAADPADQVTLADEVGYAIMVVMETLSPAERTAFVLHDLFGLAFDEVANIVGRTPGAVRQLASRARRHVRSRSPWPSTDAAEHRRVVDAFASAAASGDLAALIHLLDPDVVLVSDGGGLVSAARKPVLGPDRVARFLLGVLAREQPGDRIDRVLVNGAPGFAVYQQGTLVTIASVTVAAGRVTRVDLVRAPAKLPGHHRSRSSGDQRDLALHYVKHSGEIRDTSHLCPGSGRGQTGWYV